MGYNWEHCRGCKEDFPEEVIFYGLCPACSPVQCRGCHKEFAYEDLDNELCPTCFDAYIEEFKIREDEEHQEWLEHELQEREDE